MNTPSFDLINQTVIAGLASESFKSFFDGTAQDIFLIAALSDVEMAWLETQSREVWLSKITLDAHKRAHPEIGIADYQCIPRILAHGKIWLLPDSPARIILMEIGAVTYRMAIKRTQDGSRNYLLTLFRNTKAKPPKGAVRVR
jgi:hypothetical protein